MNFDSLLQDMGEPCTIEFEASGTFDPTTGNVSGGASESASGYCVAEPYDVLNVDGTNVLLGDVKLTISKIDNRPRVGGTVLFDSTVYRIMSVYAVRFSGSDVVYQVQGRV